ncbi:MAG: Asp-tRNA(Asn)/Glu-tRNA(Gln) amidotransferase subunit GatC [Bacteroidota bacterium]
MTLDKQLLHKLMHLARLSLPEPAALAMLSDLNKFCTWIEKLDELDTKAVPPLTTMLLEQNIMREDIPQEPLVCKPGLVNTDHAGSNYFSVPQVKD